MNSCEVKGVVVSAQEKAKYYTYTVEWCPEDRCFIAYVSEWESLETHGQSPINALLEILKMVAFAIEDCEKSGDYYPQPYHIPDHLEMN